MMIDEMNWSNPQKNHGFFDEPGSLSKSKTLHNRINLLTTLLYERNFFIFPTSLEKKFQRTYAHENKIYVKLTLLIGILLYGLSSSFDFFFFLKLHTIDIRLFTTAPILLFIVILYLSNPRLSKYHQQVLILYSFVVMISLVIIASMVPTYYKDVLYGGILFTALFIAILPKLQFKYSLILMTQSILIFNVGFQFNHIEIPAYFYWSYFGNNYILIGSTILCVISCYLQEKNGRKKFLYDELLHEKNVLLQHISRYDELTSVPNRRYFNEGFDIEWYRALRFKHTIALIFLDFDFFKQYNDLYGHQEGDRALRLLAKAISVSLKRAGDFVARYGGDEFVIVLPETTAEDALSIARLIKNQIKELHIKHAGSTVGNYISTTIGISSVIPQSNMPPSTLLKEADFALQFGKNSHRGEIYIFQKESVYMDKTIPS